MRGKISKLMVFCLVLGLMFAVATEGTAKAGVIKVTVDDKIVVMDVAPVIENGRTMVPMRPIFNALGAEISWNQDAQRVTGIKENVVIILHVDSKEALVNGEPLKLDVPAKIISGRTMVPTRFIAESLGATVDWDGATKTVVITSAPVVEPEEPQEYMKKTAVLKQHLPNNTIEIELAGATEQFIYTTDVEWVFAEMVNMGDEIVITYYTDKSGQKYVVGIELAERETMVKGVEGVYVGQIDSGSVEIIMEGEPRTFMVSEQIILANFEPNQEVLFDYYIRTVVGHEQLILNKMWEK